MNQKQKLEEYIFKTLENGTVRKNADSYETWVASHASDTANDYDAERQTTVNEAERKRAGYGLNAEGTYDNGISDSGYAKYISDMERADLDSALYEIDAEESKNEISNLQGYAAYLSGVQNKVRDKEKSYMRSLMENHSTDYSSAYELALSYGFSEEDAERLAKTAKTLSFGSPTIKSQVIVKAITSGFDYDTAYRYALACGYTNADAQKIAEITDVASQKTGSVREAIQMTSDEAEKEKNTHWFKNFLRHLTDNY